MIRLLIKGSRQDAIDALVAHGLPPTADIIEHHSKYTPNPECLVRLPLAYAARVREWLHGEPCIPPFSVGTLLYFHETELS